VHGRSSCTLEARRIGEGSTLVFSTFGTSIGRPMRRLKQMCKESTLKPSNSFVVTTQRLPPTTPFGPGVLTVRCRLPHAWSRRPYDRPGFKTTLPACFLRARALLSGCYSRMSRIPCGMRLLPTAQSGTARLTQDLPYGCTTTLGSRNARGPTAVVGLCRVRERHVRPPALDLPGLRSSCA